MNSSKRYKYKNKLEFFLSSNRGQRILNLFYSWGASCVILGALMEILRIPYGDWVLAISMLVEFAVFFISGFEKPQSTYNWEKVFPELNNNDTFNSNDNNIKPNLSNNSHVDDILKDKNYLKTITSPNDIKTLINTIESLNASINGLIQIATVVSNMSNTNINNMTNDSTVEYNSEMDSFVKKIRELNIIYENQLNSISDQIDIIDNIGKYLSNIKDNYTNSVDISKSFNEENHQMVLQLRELNQVYSRLLNALTVNTPFSRNSN